MGKSQSKVTDEKIIIAQTGAGNSAAAAAAAEMDKERLEFYLIFITIFIVIIIAYFYWKRVKRNYGRYVRRELQELPVLAVRRGEPGLNSCSTHAQHTQQVIV